MMPPADSTTETPTRGGVNEEMQYSQKTTTFRALPVGRQEARLQLFAE